MRFARKAGGKRLLLATRLYFNTPIQRLLLSQFRPLLFSPHQGSCRYFSPTFLSHTISLKPFRDPSQPAWGPSSCPCRCTHKGIKEPERREGRGKKKANYHARERKKNCNSFFLEDIRRKEKEGEKERACVRGLADPGHVAETPHISACFVQS